LADNSTKASPALIALGEAEPLPPPPEVPPPNAMTYVL
jgi:hypothetical protein